MSAFIVDKQTIDRIINGFLARRKELTYVKGIPHIPYSDEEITEFGQKLCALNVDAVNQRYDETNDIPVYVFSRQPVTHTQAYKSLQCFLYQCSEGDVPKSPLYKEMKRLGYELACHIVNDSTAYDQAEWG